MDAVSASHCQEQLAGKSVVLRSSPALTCLIPCTLAEQLAEEQQLATAVILEH